MAFDQILIDALSSSGLTSLIGAVQVTATVYVIRAVAGLSHETTQLRQLIEQQGATLGPEDPLHPGARLFWGVGVNSIEQQLGVVSERQRTIVDRQSDQSEAMKELRKSQIANHASLATEMQSLKEHAARAIAMRQDLVG